MWRYKQWILSVESKKVAITIQRCSVENQKDTINIDLYSDSPLLVLNETSVEHCGVVVRTLAS